MLKRSRRTCCYLLIARGSFGHGRRQDRNESVFRFYDPLRIQFVNSSEVTSSKLTLIPYYDQINIRSVLYVAIGSSSLSCTSALRLPYRPYLENQEEQFSPCILLASSWSGFGMSLCRYMTFAFE